MTAYNKTTDFAIKDTLLTGNPSKVVRGSEINTEFVAIQSADADNVKISGLATGVATFLATPSSANLAAVITDETGSGSAVFATSPTLVTPALGTPSALVGTNITGTAAGLTAGNVTTNANLTGHVTSVGNAAVLGSFTSAQLATALTDETGSGAAVFATSPTLVTPALGTPSSLVGTNITGTAAGLTAGNVTTNANLTGHVTSVGNAAVLGSFTAAQLNTAVSDADVATIAGTETLTNKTLTTPVLTNPSYSGTTANGGTVTTIDINGGTIDGAVIGGTTPVAGSFTTVNASGTVTAATGNDGLGFAVTGATTGYAYQTVANTGGTALLGVENSTGATLHGLATAYDTVIRAKAGTGILLGVEGAAFGARVTATGLSVTGALSATGNVTTADDLIISKSTASTSLRFNNSGSNLVIGTDNSTGVSFSGGGVPYAANYYTFGAVPHIWSIFSGEKMRLDASGNLGLGVVPSAWSGIRAIELGGGAYFGSNGGNSVYLGQNNYFNGANYIYKATAEASRYQQTLGAHYWLTAPSGTAGNAISFTQAMTLDASGNLLVGQTSSGTANSNSVEIGILGRTVINHVDGASTGSYYSAFAYAAGVIGSITQSGTTAVAYNTTSDHRLKTNVRPANAARFADIEFVDFEWTDGRHDCGVIADQLQSVYPDLVLGAKDATEVRTVEITPAVPAVLDEDGEEVTPAIPAVTEEQTFPVYQQVNYQGLIARMGTRVQKLMEQVATLEADKTMLLTVLASVDSRLMALEAA